MDRFDRTTRPYGDDDRDATKRTVAPPIEREHETYAGIFEEDERREREHEQQARRDP